MLGRIKKGIFQELQNRIIDKVKSILGSGLDTVNCILIRSRMQPQLASKTVSNCSSLATVREARPPSSVDFAPSPTRPSRTLRGPRALTSRSGSIHQGGLAHLDDLRVPRIQSSSWHGISPVSEQMNMG